MNATHPSRDELTAFGVGKLDSVSANSVQQHLVVCEDCRRVVAESSGDSVLGRMRDSRKPSGTVLPDKSISALALSLNAAASTGQPLPPELTNNREYERVEELGRGGMGVVYKAHNTLMGRDEVLKVMSREIMSRPGALERFRREIQSAARLDHPNIVKAYSARLLGDLLVFSMEYVPGDELGKLVTARGPLPVVNACYYIQQVTKGLQHAHDKDMVHRDIKPANLILHREGKVHTVKILDFGLAKVTSEASFEGGLTGEGRMLGTPDYIAPEQILDAQSADIRADIYSLGCTLHFLLAGAPPFKANSLYELLRQHREVDPPLLNTLRPEVPPELAAVVARMLAKDPMERFLTPAEVGKALAPFLVKPSSLPVVKAILVEEPPQAMPAQAIPVASGWSTILPEASDETEPETAPRTREVAMNRSRRPVQSLKHLWLWPAVGLGIVCVLGLSLWAGGAFKSKTKDGTVVQEAPLGKPAVVDALKNSVETPKKSPDEFPGSTPSRVQITPESPIAPDRIAETILGGSYSNDQFVSVFNRKDLSGWKNEGKNNWTVDAGKALLGEGPDAAIFTTCEEFKEFTLRAELSASADVNAVVLLRQYLLPDGKRQAMTWRMTGNGKSVVGQVGPSDSNFKLDRGPRIELKPDEVFMLEASVVVNHASFSINGGLKPTFGFRPTPPPGTGRIGFVVTKGTLRVSKVEIKGVPLTKPSAGIWDK